MHEISCFFSYISAVSSSEFTHSSVLLLLIFQLQDRQFKWLRKSVLNFASAEIGWEFLTAENTQPINLFEIKTPAAQLAPIWRLVLFALDWFWNHGMICLSDWITRRRRIFWTIKTTKPCTHHCTNTRTPQEVFKIVYPAVDPFAFAKRAAIEQ